MTHHKIFFVLCVTLTVVIVNVSPTPSSQLENDPMVLIQKIETHRQQIIDLVQEGLVVTEAKSKGMVKRIEREFSAAFKRPNYFLFQLKGESSLLTVSDGQSLWNYREGSGTYAKRVAPKESHVYDHWIGQFIPLQLGSVSMFLPPSQKTIQEIKLIGQETLQTKSAGPILCYLLEAEMSLDMLETYDRAHMKVWIGTQDYMTWKIESTLVPKQPFSEREVKITMLNSVNRLGVGLTNSYFAFTPPVGAQPLRE